MTVAVALLGGYLFHLVHLPLPWLLGTITFTMVWKFAFRRDIECHKSFRPAALLIIGYNIGSSFTRETGSLLAQHLPYMLISTLLTVGASYLIMLLMLKLLKANLMTSILSCVPGGISIATMLAQESRSANVTVVVFSQTMRILAIIYTVPFLVVHMVEAKPLPITVPDAGTAGAAGWHVPVLIVLASLACARLLKKFRLPVPELLGTVAAIIILVYCGVEVPALPDVIVIAAQMMMGISLADSMTLEGLSNWRKLAPFTVITSFFLVMACLGIAYLLTVMTSLDFATAFLGTAAGGIAEMVLTGALVGANLPVIAAYQLFRILSIMVVFPPLARLLMRRETPETEGFHG
jgi:hypothetical protein